MAAAQLNVSPIVRTILLIASLALLPLTNAADKIKDAIDRGLVTKEFANSPLLDAMEDQLDGKEQKKRGN